MDKERRFKTVLLVDDDMVTNEYHQYIIDKFMDYENIITVSNGEEALNYLTKSRADASFSFPELIFLDINMPIMGGWEFLEEYVKFPLSLRKRTHLAMVSSSINREDEEKALATEGVNQYIRKPLVLAHIRKIIENNPNS